MVYIPLDIGSNPSASGIAPGRGRSTTAVVPKLIYDIGLHAGEDAAFYLRKGFRVIGVDADDAMCCAAAERLARYVRDGRVKIVNVAIAEASGTVTFYKSARPQWNTLVPRWRDQNAAFGSTFTESKVEAITLAELVKQHGQPHYIKVDIEGMDALAVRSLLETDVRPTFISIESAFPRDPTLASIKNELRTLSELGYDRFKIVPQHKVEEQIPPKPSRDGRYVPHRFECGSSGLFGDEAPGHWMILGETVATFRSIVRRSRLPAMLHRRLALYGLYCRVLERLTGIEPDLGWYDIHATRSRISPPSAPAPARAPASARRATARSGASNPRLRG